MSKLTGGRWPSTLSVVDLRLPRDWTARSAVVLDRVNFVAISSDTLGRYARDLYGVSDDVLHAGLTRDFAPDVTVTVERAGMPVAFVVVEERATELWLDHMVIEPSAQGEGIGTEIVQWVQTAAARSSKNVALSVVDGNRAQELYARLGFAITRVEPPRTFMEWSFTRPQPAPAAPTEL